MRQLGVIKASLLVGALVQDLIRLFPGLVRSKLDPEIDRKAMEDPDRFEPYMQSVADDVLLGIDDEGRTRIQQYADLIQAECQHGIIPPSEPPAALREAVEHDASIIARRFEMVFKARH